MYYILLHGGCAIQLAIHPFLLSSHSNALHRYRPIPKHPVKQTGMVFTSLLEFVGFKFQLVASLSIFGCECNF